jgi:hypothetical protein
MKGVVTAFIIYLAFLGIAMLSAQFLSVDAWGTPGGEEERLITQTVEKFSTWFDTSQLSAEDKEALRSTSRLVVSMTIEAYLAIAMANVTLVAVLIYLVIRSLRFRRQGVQMLRLPQFQVPEPMIWLLIVAGFALVPDSLTLNRIGLNVGLLLLGLYLVQGFAVMAHLFERHGIPQFLRIAGYLLPILVVPLSLLFATVGIADLWGRFRIPRPENL